MGKMFDARIELLSSKALRNRFAELVTERKSGISARQKSKQEVSDRFAQMFRSKTYSIRQRVGVVNAYIAMEKDFRVRYEQSVRARGATGDNFEFAKTLVVESPLEHMKSLFDEFFLTEKIPTDKRELSNIEEYIAAFCFDESGYRSGKNPDELLEELKNFELEYRTGREIRYSVDGGMLRGHISDVSRHPVEYPP